MCSCAALSTPGVSPAITGTWASGAFRGWGRLRPWEYTDSHRAPLLVARIAWDEERWTALQPATRASPATHLGGRFGPPGWLRV
jgi:hypothetical protein